MMQQTNRVYKKLSSILAVSYLVYAFIYIFYGEKVPVNNGMGWDGAVYGNAVKNFTDLLKTHSINSYQLQRIFPSGVICLIFNLTGIVFNNKNIIMAFEFYNILLIMLCIVLWFRIAKKITLNDHLVFLGLSAIIITFPVLKFSLYYPVLTDCTALFLGFFVLYGFITQKNSFLFISILISSFTWAIASVSIPLLLIFNRSKKLKPLVEQKINLYLFIAGLLVLDAFIYYFFIIRQNMSSRYPAYLFMTPGKFEYINLAAGTLCLNIFLFACFRFLLKNKILDTIRIFVNAVNYKWLLISVFILSLIKLYSSGFPPPTDIKFSWYFIALFTTPALQPFVNLMCMILFFGPVIYLLIFRWNMIAEHVYGYGAGFMIFFVFNLIQCLDAESRHLMFFYPFLLFLVFESLKNYKFSPFFTGFFLVIAFLFSKAWFQINIPEFVHSILNDQVLTKEVHQRYFMHTGVFMNYKNYLLQLPVVTIAGWFLFLLLRKQIETENISGS